MHEMAAVRLSRQLPLPNRRKRFICIPQNYCADMVESIYKDHTTTLKMFFNNDEAAFQAVNPMNLLQHPTPERRAEYRRLAGWFIAGTADEHSQQALRQLHEIAQNAGIDSRYTEIPGSHTARVWRTGFGQTLPFAVARGGLTAVATNTDKGTETSTNTRGRAA